MALDSERAGGTIRGRVDEEVLERAESGLSISKLGFPDEVDLAPPPKLKGVMVVWEYEVLDGDGDLACRGVSVTSRLDVPEAVGPCCLSEARIE